MKNVSIVAKFECLLEVPSSTMIASLMQNKGSLVSKMVMEQILDFTE
jgi:hypothetical protein